MSCNVCATHCKHCVKLQIMNLSHGELEWVCSHLGHDVQLDRNFYRLQTGVVELAKVTKLLLASERGIIAKYKGISLAEIDIGIEG